jgi:hypothetical protein
MVADELRHYARREKPLICPVNAGRHIRVEPRVSWAGLLFGRATVPQGCQKEGQGREGLLF